MRGEVSVQLEDPRQPDVLRLFSEANAYFQVLYPSESNHLVGAEDLVAEEAVFLAARRDGQLLGSIAFRVLTPEHAEMKRMFVRIDARGTGLGRRLLHALEDDALRRGIKRISLETGIKQPEAIGLYRAAGYQDCPPFGEYKSDPLSLFMTKSPLPQPAQS